MLLLKTIFLVSTRNTKKDGQTGSGRDKDGSVLVQTSSKAACRFQLHPAALQSKNRTEQIRSGPVGQTLRRRSGSFLQLPAKGADPEGGGGRHPKPFHLVPDQNLLFSHPDLLWQRIQHRRVHRGGKAGVSVRMRVLCSQQNTKIHGHVNYKNNNQRHVMMTSFNWL